MSLQSVIQEAASVANVFSVLVLAAGYYFMVKLYREWVHMRRETRAAGGRPQVVVAADYGHLPAVSVVVGNTLLSGLAEEPLSVLRAFAGAVLASVADTLMPDAYREGGPLVAFATAAGFLLSFVLSHS